MFDAIPIEYAIPIIQERCVGSRYEALSPSISSIAALHLKGMNKNELDCDWKLNEFFGTIFVIHLPKDVERLSRSIEELGQVGVQEFEIFSGINGREDMDVSIWKKFYHNRIFSNPETEEGKLALERLHQGEAGCYMSHYRLIEAVRKSFIEAIDKYHLALSSQNAEAVMESLKLVRKYSRVLVLEDDNGFGIVNRTKSKSSKKGAGHLLRLALRDLPDDWDMLYFMAAAHEKALMVSSHLCRLKRSAFLNAYAVNYTMYDKLLDILKTIEDPLIDKIWPVDKAISRMHYRHKVFAIYPSIAFQYDGFSVIDSTYSSKLIQCQPMNLSH